MQRAKTSHETLTKIYAAFIRPVIEYASVVYGPLMTDELARKMEGLQRTALGIIHARLLEVSKLESLGDRRKEALRTFVIKNAGNHHFSTDWFPQNNKRSLRRTEKYKITKSNFDRLRCGQLNQMRACLNDLEME